MDETKKTINKKQIIFSIIGIAGVIALVVCFVIAFKNHKTNASNSSNTNTATTLSSSKITSGGTYKITGDNECITINTTDSIELNLENATITCENGPAINVKNAKNVNQCNNLCTCQRIN